MIHKFGDFELDEESWEVRRGGTTIDVPPKVMETLSFLVRNRQRVVQKEELFAELWPNTSVTDASLMKAIRIARQILGDDGDSQRVIKTVRGRGYRFVAPVQSEEGALPATARREEPAASEPFLDREAELRELEAGLGRAIGGQTLGFLISGDAGIGKTRLAEVFAALAEARGMNVLWGRCCEEGGAPELRPWIQVLTRLFQLEGGADQTGEREPIARLFPDRGHPEDAAWPLLRTEPERFRAFDTIVQILRRAARRTPLLLILEDLHTADAASLILTHFLLRELRDASLVVVGTYRPAELDREATTPQLFGKLVRETRAIALSGLSESGTRRLIENALSGGEADARLVAQVHRVTEGNPLFVSELVRLLSSERPRQDAGQRELRVPERIFEALRGRFERLPAATHELLSAASVIGREFELPLLRALTALDEPDLLARLQPALERRIVAARPPRHGAFQFTHILFRDVLYEELEIRRRAELHGKIGELIESYASGTADPEAALLAHHFLRAALGAGSRKGAEYSIAAGKHALSSFAAEEAALHLERALEALRYERGSEALAGEALLSLGHAQRLSGDYAAAGESFDRALGVARKLGDPVALAKAALGYAQVNPEMGTVNLDLIPRLEEAVAVLRAVADPTLPVVRELLALALGRLGLCLAFALRPDEADALSREAIEKARALGQPAVLSNALLARHWVIWLPSSAAERFAISEELIGLERRNQSTALPEARLCQIFDLLELGRRDALDSSIAAYGELAQQLRDPLALWNARVFETMLALLEGRFAEAEARARETLQVGRKIHDLNSRIYFVAHLFWIRCEQGRPGEVEKATSDQWILSRSERLRLACEAGDAEATQKILDGAAKRDFKDLRRDWTWFPALAHIAAACALVGDAPRAAMVEAILLPHEHLHVVLGPAVVYLGPVTLYLALCARAQSHFDAAIAWGERALSQCAHLGARPTAARAHLHLAESYARRGQSGDRVRAADAAERAVALGRELGMQEIERQASALEVKMRDQPPTRPSHSRP